MIAFDVIKAIQWFLYIKNPLTPKQRLEMECAICKIEPEFNPGSGDPLITDDNPGQAVGPTGRSTLLSCCQTRNKNSLLQHINKLDTILVHKSCRKRFIDLRKIKSSRDEKEPPTKRTRASAVNFAWKTNCFICGIMCDPKHDETRHASTISLKDNVMAACRVFPDDGDVQKIVERLATCNDLVHVQAIYHPNCFTKLIKRVLEDGNVETHHIIKVSSH